MPIHGHSCSVLHQKIIFILQLFEGEIEVCLVESFPIPPKNQISKFPWSPGVLGGGGGYSDKPIHCDDCPLTSVVCDTHQRRQWLACSFVDVVLPWFTRSSSALTTFYCYMWHSFRQHIMSAGMTESRYLATLDDKDKHEHWDCDRVLR